MENNKTKSRIGSKIFFSAIAIFVLYHYLYRSFSTDPYIKYGKIISNMKKISDGECIKKIKVELPSKPFLKPKSPSTDTTEFYVILKDNDYSEEFINQIGEELKIVLDKEIEGNERLSENFSTNAGIIIALQDPDADWLSQFQGWADNLIIEWSQERYIPPWDDDAERPMGPPKWR
jgi:hypothetical protein